MKRFGFTLAEVLITLGIIGVISTVTLSALNSNVQRAQVGPKLAKAINTIETAGKTYTQSVGARNVMRACINAGYGETGDHNSARNFHYLQCLVEQGGLQATRVAIPSIRDFNRRVLNGWDMVDAYRTKDGVEFYGEDSVWGMNEALLYTLRSYHPKAWSVFVDIDGSEKGSNSLGRDVFWLIIDGYGTVIPFGGRVHAELNGLENPVWENSCNRNVVQIGGNAPAGAACAGSVVDNDYNVIYPLR